MLVVNLSIQRQWRSYFSPIKTSRLNIVTNAKCFRKTASCFILSFSLIIWLLLSPLSNELNSAMRQSHAAFHLGEHEQLHRPVFFNLQCVY